MIQIIRYRDSPVGPYDELLVVPGSFDWSRDGPDGRREVGRNPRITRIYVSQKHTCYNGRVSKFVPVLLCLASQLHCVFRGPRCAQAACVYCAFHVASGIDGIGSR